MPDPDVAGRERELAAEATRLHAFYRGKMETVPRCRVRDLQDFALWYTPGVAAPCRAIQADPELVYDYTSKGNTVAVVSDGTRVLGLGDIGPAAGLPVMEGKALLYKYLGGVDAVPIVLDTRDPDELIRTVLLLAPSFGGINLEDIAQPKCFRILERLRAEAPIPVWHDDQQGTATVTLAGLLNALQGHRAPHRGGAHRVRGQRRGQRGLRPPRLRPGRGPGQLPDGGQPGHPGPPPGGRGKAQGRVHREVAAVREHQRRGPHGRDRGGPAGRGRAGGPGPAGARESSGRNGWRA